jgi:uncharacterized protein
MKNQSTALITGASGGIGYEFAKNLAQRGVNLVLVARSEPKLNQIKAELEKSYGIKVEVLAQDLGDSLAPSAIYSALQNSQIDILINNAGFGDFGAFSDTNWEKESQMIDLNIKALTHLTKLFLPAMKQRKNGKILNVASTAAFQPGPLMAVYYATKAFVLSFSEALASELEGTGVTVTTLCPGPTESGFQAASAMEDSKLVKGKKMPTAKEVADFGIQAMFKGKRVVVHGFMNRLLSGLIPFLPRKMVTNIVKNMQAASH